MSRLIRLASLGRGYLRGRLKQSLRTKDKSPKNPQRKAAFVGLALASAAFALPSPWSWITFVIGIQLFAPLVGKAFKSSDELSREETIRFLENQLDSLGKDIARAEKFETGLTTHNKRIKYKAYFEMLEKIRNDA
ncbi:MAG: hypothetical protein E6Q97_25175 [Desulfurellales bacterium]|nr:MAG: hypothetical protein E6Q97_25175 [Desulfurellales bacterium]